MRVETSYLGPNKYQNNFEYKRERSFHRADKKNHYSRNGTESPEYTARETSSTQRCCHLYNKIRIILAYSQEKRRHCTGTLTHVRSVFFSESSEFQEKGRLVQEFSQWTSGESRQGEEVIMMNFRIQILRIWMAVRYILTLM